MSMTASTPQAAHSATAPRGRMILSLALLSWMIFAGAWLVLARLFAFVQAAL